AAAPLRRARAGPGLARAAARLLGAARPGPPPLRRGLLLLPPMGRARGRRRPLRPGRTRGFPPRRAGAPRPPPLPGGPGEEAASPREGGTPHRGLRRLPAADPAAAAPVALGPGPPPPGPRPGGRAGL